MSEAGERMTDGSRSPDVHLLAQWLGAKHYQYWRRIVDYIDRTYPNVFQPEWLFGGQKHGWSLRFKKSKSFCTLIPGRERLVVLIVLGRAEREETERILPKLSPMIRKVYTEATTYHDGKWLAIVAGSERALSDIELLLAIKRRPKDPSDPEPLDLAKA